MTGPIYLARHGETDYNRERRFQGQGAVGLNPRGREQAHALAAAAQGHELQALYCSPLPRARETAEIVGAALALTPLVDERFMETDTGEWTDRLFADVEREQPDAYAAYYATDPGFAFPGGESLRDQRTRVLAALEDVRQGPTPALVIAHRGVIRCVIDDLATSCRDLRRRVHVAGTCVTTARCEAPVTRVARYVFAALVVATFGAFFVAQRLKNGPTLVQNFYRDPVFSPTKDGRLDRLRLSFLSRRRTTSPSTSSTRRATASSASRTTAA